MLSVQGALAEVLVASGKCMAPAAWTKAKPLRLSAACGNFKAERGSQVWHEVSLSSGVP